MKTFPDYKTKSVKDLIPYARNSRTHSEAQVAQIAASIKEFGFLNPIIIDGENGIIAGHGRVLAAQKLGLKELPCIEAKHLTDTQRRAYVIADNKLALNAGWDDEMLRVELDELSGAGFDLELTGFTLGEIEGLALGEELTGGERGATPSDQLEDYESGTVRQIVLIMDVSEFEETMSNLAKIKDRLQLKTNTEASMEAIRNYANNHLA